MKNNLGSMNHGASWLELDGVQYGEKFTQNLKQHGSFGSPHDVKSIVTDFIHRTMQCWTWTNKFNTRLPGLQLYLHIVNLFKDSYQEDSWIIFIKLGATCSRSFLGRLVFRCVFYCNLKQSLYKIRPVPCKTIASKGTIALVVCHFLHIQIFFSHSPQ